MGLRPLYIFLNISVWGTVQYVLSVDKHEIRGLLFNELQFVNQHDLSQWVADRV